ncbi:hypothetical protein E2C01_004567 [Portunus trituberculatus]|uniref:Uncharacterized protein n=1 Tax=Portunus trituberculatus TaxID=210409 RepID=A0A5B7CQB1_PORTR|nr:hypothetical protein [Portunus trituberculatus]
MYLYFLEYDECRLMIVPRGRRNSPGERGTGILEVLVKCSSGVVQVFRKWSLRCNGEHSFDRHLAPYCLVPP